MGTSISIMAGIAVASLISNLILLLVILTQQHNSQRERRNKELYIDRELSKLDSNIVQVRDDIYELLSTEIPEIKSKLNNLEESYHTSRREMNGFVDIFTEKVLTGNSRELHLVATNIREKLFEIRKLLGDDSKISKKISKKKTKEDSCGSGECSCKSKRE